MVYPLVSFFWFLGSPLVPQRHPPCALPSPICNSFGMDAPKKITRMQNAKATKWNAYHDLSGEDPHLLKSFIPEMNSSGSDLLKEHQSTYMHQIQSEYMHQAARRLPLHHASPPRTIFQLILVEACTLRNTISTLNTNAGVSTRSNGVRR